MADQVAKVKRPGDIAILSIHWGENWGYQIPRRQTLFARKLVDVAGIDMVHGHSSHHPKGIEIYKNKPILYGCGDFLNDYEGIAGYENFRSHLVSAYFPTLDAWTGNLLHMEIVPFVTKRFQLHRAKPDGRGMVGRPADARGKAARYPGESGWPEQAVPRVDTVVF